jgi:hypothetical protein
MQNDTLAKFIKQQYPPGTRIRLDAMNDPYDPIPSGTLGKVDFVDDAGQIHMKWDNGSGLAIVPGEDRFSVVEPERRPMKLYMPLHGDLYERNKYGDLEEYPCEMDGRELVAHQDAILAMIERQKMPEERERGLMNWFHGDEAINAKVRYYNFTVEERFGQLWGVADCEITADLTPSEMEEFKETVVAQAADGAGESLEQREIHLPDREELYVHLWDSGDRWSLMTEAEFEAAHGQEYGGMQFGNQI